MFILSRLKSLVRLPPAEWVKPLPDALADAINSKLANTVLHEVGLVVAVFDLVEIGESYVFPGDGASHTNVTFRVVVFRPALDEILVGRIKSCTAGEGVAVTLGFFDDIIIPPEALQHPYRFDENEQVVPLWYLLNHTYTFFPALRCGSGSILLTMAIMISSWTRAKRFAFA
jgi:DNA-directed RNA polymerase III subunit RPC8